MVLREIILCLALVCTVRSAEICCNLIGCFTDDPPFDGIALPFCVERMSPHYNMYTRQNRDVGVEFDHTSIPTVFDGSLQTIFLIHGWNSDGTSSWLHSMKNAFLDRDFYNVVIVDWGGGAQLANYFQAASNTRSIGAYTAMVFANLVANGGSDTLTWCIGHSLGAHHCGHAGMRTSLERVTGLDPAGPWFQGKTDKTVGVNPTSARFVDIIHTDNTLGQLQDLGHMDFYPGGGASQPGCLIAEFDDDPDAQPDPRNSCDHSRAHQYMEASIRQNCFLSRSKCTDYNSVPGSCVDCTCGSEACAAMGFSANTGCQRSGLFYLDVVATAPYCVSAGV